jgi:solute carrier family 39 (zinc transporter), member 1/2/3
MLATSAIAVFLPLVLNRLPFRGAINSFVFTSIKQFGTGVIISTGFVHLYTHAYLMFTSPCIQGVDFEGTTSAFVMAGLFLAFLVEYIGHRIVVARARKHQTPNGDLPSSTDTETHDSSTTTSSKEPGGNDIPQQPPPPPQKTLVALGHHHGNPFSPTNPNSKLSVLVMEAGVLFHSILIGITLVVAGDSFYRTLLVVIIFHQFFEGLALGARIALIPSKIWPEKILMGAAFALITPLGMGIGIGVLNQFNGNDSATLWVIGVLDALSAGVLIWVGVVDMWARDWVVEGGEMVEAKLGLVGVGIVSLIAGLVVMSVLGKWA